MEDDRRPAARDGSAGAGRGGRCDGAGKAVWDFTSLDPATAGARRRTRWPASCPPNVKAPEGQGGVSYSVVAARLAWRPGTVDRRRRLDRVRHERRRSSPTCGRTCSTTSRRSASVSAASRDATAGSNVAWGGTDAGVRDRVLRRVDVRGRRRVAAGGAAARPATSGRFPVMTGRILPLRRAGARLRRQPAGRRSRLTRAASPRTAPPRRPRRRRAARRPVRWRRPPSPPTPPVVSSAAAFGRHAGEREGRQGHA